jgi:hypothetical protein
MPFHWPIYRGIDIVVFIFTRVGLSVLGAGLGVGLLAECLVRWQDREQNGRR